MAVLQQFVDETAGISVPFLFSTYEEPNRQKVKTIDTLQKARYFLGSFRDTMLYNSCCSLSICKITDFLWCK